MMITPLLSLALALSMLGPQDDAGVRTEVLTFRAADQRGCGEQQRHRGRRRCPFSRRGVVEELRIK